MRFRFKIVTFAMSYNDMWVIKGICKFRVPHPCGALLKPEIHGKEKHKML